MRYILSIDQSTSGTKAGLMNEQGTIVRKSSRPHAQYYPAPGWVEHDAEEIFQNTVRVIENVLDGVPAGAVAAMGIANQRETTVVWDRATGKPLCPAVVWQDVRGAALCRELAAHADTIKRTTGLALSPYYPAAKAAHVLQNHRFDADICIGTIDAYLVYRLTQGRVFATDVSNASRTQLAGLETHTWDAELCRIFGISPSFLPDRVLSSDAYYGEYRGIPIHAVMGDSHASLFGHGCHRPGMVKTSYGTGSSIMMNTGGTPVRSQNGLSTSVAFGYRGEVSYVLEGNVTCSADTLAWLRDELELISDVAEVEALAASVLDTQGVYLVPAFSGLGAPYFDENARAVLYGMNRGTRRAHVVRAALESIAHQNADVLDAMARDMGAPVAQLNADGGGSVNALLMQLQADLIPGRTVCTDEPDLTMYGVGRMAGIAAGLYQAFAPPRARAVYEPQMREEKRAAMRAGWADAVRRSR